MHSIQAGTAHGNDQGVDPVCGMTVDKRTAAGSFEHDGERYFFCSAHCLDAFRKDPARFVNRSRQQPEPVLPKPIQISRREFTCPMHPEVRQSGPGACPKCGMGLEPSSPHTPAPKIEYTCPMHPEIVRNQLGSCPICGMALEPRTISLEEETNPELVDMTKRFWIGVALTVPLLAIAMSDLVPGHPLEQVLSPKAMGWVEMALATPVVLWGGWPFFQRFWMSLVHRSPNMFTLIGLGTGAAYLDSLTATLFPQVFPASFRAADGAFTMALGAQWGSRLASRVGRAVILGIRPEDILILPEGSTSERVGTVRVRLDVVEPLGSEAFLSARIGAKEITARVPPRGLPTAGSEVELVFNAERLHFFDAESGGTRWVE